MTYRTTMRLKTALLAKVDEQYTLVVDIAKSNIEGIRQRLSGDIELAYLDSWERALADKEQLKQMIADTSDEGLSSWQIAPFNRMFTAKERWLILKDDELSDAASESALSQP